MANTGATATSNGDQTVWFTICARNYFAYAQTLFQSLRRHEPDARFVVFLADEPFDGEAIDTPGLEIVPAASLGITHFADMTVRYDVMELATAIKPDCFRYLFARPGVERAVYLDPDIFVTSPLREIHCLFDNGAELILTPHIRKPFRDTAHPDDAQIMRAGVYNLGFAAMGRSEEVNSLLHWWSDKLRVTGHNDLTRGQFVDQRYMDLAPAFVARTEILRHAGYNAAYWNLHERVIGLAETGREPQWRADGDPLAFFHFSGVVPGDGTIFSKHQNRYEPEDLGDLTKLLDDYLGHLARNGHEHFSAIPYAYDRDARGLPLTKLMRTAFASRFPDGSPLSEPSSALTKTPSNTLAHFDLSWITAPPNDGKERTSPEDALPPLLSEAWRSRPDLQRAFTLTTPADRLRFTRYFVDEGAKIFGLPTPVIEACADALQVGKREGPKSMLARGAGRVLAAAPSLRPLYQHIPLGVRGRVKTALFRTAARETDISAVTQALAAIGKFDPARAPGIQLYGYLNAKSGIGASARGLASLMDDAKIPYGTTRLSNPGDIREGAVSSGRSSLPARYRISLINANAEQVLAIDELIDPFRLKGSYRIGYWAWELAQFPGEWLPALDRLDEVWVPSTFVADSLRVVTHKPIIVMPHLAPDMTGSAQTAATLPPAIPGQAVLFFTALDLNSYIARKNPLATIFAFRDAFRDQGVNNPDAPHLFIQINGDQNAAADMDAVRAAVGTDPHIHLMQAPLSDAAFFALHRRADVFVSLHRSEGYGLNMAAAMAAGKPVIATAYSGNMDFMDDRCAMPISHQLVPVPPGAYPHGVGQVWAEPDHDAAVAAMRTLAHDGDQRSALGARAATRIARHSGPPVLRAKIQERLAFIDPALADISGPHTP
ncbi:MAG: glycosyltransferase [Pseudomonadota bacterium]